MTVYNVKLSIIDLIEADSADEAVAILRQRVNSAGLTVYEGDEPDAFQSENLSDRELEELRLDVEHMAAHSTINDRTSFAGEAMRRLRQWERGHGDIKTPESRQVCYLIFRKLLGLSHEQALKGSGLKD